MIYNPALDGLRAFAILLVALFHARAPWITGGFIGVDVFFVLSGYLITSLLLAELDRHGRIDFLAFWSRRFWRLAPALLAMLAVYVVVAPLAWPDIKDHGIQAGIAALYLSDYTVALWGTPTRLNHTWSLSVEMHFYLLWPLLMALAWQRWKGPRLVQVLLAGWVLATLMRWVCTIQGQEWHQVYYRADTHMSGLVLGAWLAAALRERTWRDALHRLLPWLLWVSFAGILLLHNYWGHVWMQVWGLALAEWATVPVLIALQQPTSQLGMMFSRPALVWLGKMSYGMYLWHFPIFIWLRGRTTWDVILLAGLPASLALAALSFHTVEAWAVRWRGGRGAAQPAG